MKYLILSLIALTFIFNLPDSKPKVKVRYVAVTAEYKAEKQDEVLLPQKEYIPQNEIEEMICQVFGKDCKTALALASCESGLRPDAIGDHAIAYMVDGVEYGKSYGLFQIRHLEGRPSPSELLDPVFNIEYAKALFDRSGGYPWSVYQGSCYQSKLASL